MHIVLGVQAVERISLEAAADRISRCGLGTVTIRYEDELQSHVLTAQGAASASDQQLRCADTAAGYYDLELPDAAQQRFNAIRSDRTASLVFSEAKEWLIARGLLGRVPKYAKGTTNETAFTQEVEQLCGPRATGAFRSSYGPDVLSQEWIKRELGPGNSGSDVLACLLNVTTIAGFDIGIVGNEALPNTPRSKDC